MYTYKEKRAKAIAHNSTVEDRLALFLWMEDHDMREWNGESFDIDNGLRLYPIYNITYDKDGEIEEIELIDAEVR